MKKLNSIEVGDYLVEIDAEEATDGIIFMATCGGTRREGKLAMHPNHEHSYEQFTKNVEEFTELLAKEAAGHEHSRKHRKDFFSKLTMIG